MDRLQPGFTLGGRYALRERVGVGGMGEVWSANDTLLARTVAVKIRHPRTVDEVVYEQRFREEAMHTAGLSHLNIATLFDFGEDQGLSYLVMELVRGITLQQLLEHEGAQPPGRVRSVIGQAAMALSVAHEAGIVHRDVKPANIMVTSDGTVKLTDFGIARSSDSSALTRKGELLGTPYYVSPEQALGEVATPASDIYALGIVAHELLTGHRPFDKGTPIATALAQVQDAPPDLPTGVPDDLADVIGRCLAKDPRERPRYALEVADALGIRPLESGWHADVETEPTPRRAVASSDERSSRRGGSAVDDATAPMAMPADWDDDWDDVGSTPPSPRTPSTGDIREGAFAGAKDVRNRIAEGFGADPANAADQADDAVDAADAGREVASVVADEQVDLDGSPWPEAAAGRPTPSFDDVPPAPVSTGDEPRGLILEASDADDGGVADLGQPVSASPLVRVGGRGVPVGWVIVLILVAVAFAWLVFRLV